jgi:hypothetical protein
LDENEIKRHMIIMVRRGYDRILNYSDTLLSYPVPPATERSRGRRGQS